MKPRTFYGYYNKFIRGHPYNDRTAYILDHNFKPNIRFLSTLVDRESKIKSSRKRKYKKAMADIENI